MCSSTTETENKTETQAVLSFIHNSGSIATFENAQLSLDMDSDSDSMCIHGIQYACVRMSVCVSVVVVPASCGDLFWRAFSGA